MLFKKKIEIIYVEDFPITTVNTTAVTCITEVSFQKEANCHILMFSRCDKLIVNKITLSEHVQK